MWEIIFEGVKKFGAEIISTLLLAFALWIFPGLRSVFRKSKDFRENKSEVHTEKAQSDNEGQENSVKDSSVEAYAKRQYELGKKCYASKNYADALQWYIFAAERGVVPAQYDLALMYKNGEGTLKNESEAVKWFSKAAEKGYPDAQYELGNMYYKEGYLVDGQSLFLLNDCQEAAKWYRLAAEQGHVEAQYMMGRMYDKGRGVKQNYLEAFMWYRRAAEKGHAAAQYCTGNMCEKGDGVKQDYSEARKWYSRAAEQGYAKAQNALARLG